jgi:hypothetical protein
LILSERQSILTVQACEPTELRQIPDGIVNGGRGGVRLGFAREALTFPGTDHENTLALLRNAMIARIEYPRFGYFISGRSQRCVELISDRSVLRCHKARHVFHNEPSRLQLGDHACELGNERVPRIVCLATSDHGETLAARSTEDAVDGTQLPFRLTISCGAAIGSRQQVWAAYVAYVRAHDFRSREVAFVGGEVDGIEIDGRERVETGLFKAEGHPPGSAEEFDSS